MNISTQVTINAPKEAVWRVVSDIENAANTIEAIELIEILNRPEAGLEGLEWRETRTMFGKKATEVMRITEAVDNSHYMTYAENHGAVYKSGLSVSESDGKTVLRMSFEGHARTFGAKIMSALMGWMFKGATRKAIHKDLEDIKRVVESQTA